MSLFEGKKNPFVLQYIKHSRKVIQRGNNERDFFADTLQLCIELYGVVYMFYCMWAQYCVKLTIFKRQVVDIVYLLKERQLFMPENINIQSTTVSFTTTDI